MPTRILLSIVPLALLTTVGFASEVIYDVRPLSLTPVESAALERQPRKLHDLPLKFSPFNTQRPREPQRHGVLSDRVEYWTDDTVGQFVIYFIGEQLSSPGVELTIRLVSGEGNTTGQTIDSHKVSRPAAPKYALLVKTGLLSPGRYRLSAELTGIPGARKIPDCVFIKTARQLPRVTLPGEGIPIIISPQEVLRETLWPINTGVPLPRNVVKTVDRLVMVEDGRPVPAQISTRATWYPGQEVKWLGLDFLARYSKGKPASYRLALLPEGRPASPSRSSLRVTVSGGSFIVETGKVRFVVNRRRFTGIEEVWLAEEKGDYSQQALKGEGGPALVDERGVLFRASDDPSPTVRLMDQGPVRVTLQASGWYTSSRYNERLCKFQTWISAYADQSRIDLTHRTILTYDTDRKKLADLRFDFKTTAAPRWSCGGDGKVIGGPILQTNETTWIHQDRWDHYRLVTQNGETTQGKRSDGWAAVAQSFGVTAVVLRNPWQLYPKELEMGRNSLTVHFWPRHGRRVFSEPQELAPRNLQKLFFAHQGQYLDLKTPDKYLEVCRREYGGDGKTSEGNLSPGNGQGLAISNDFSLFFVPGPSGPEEPQDLQLQAVANQAALYQINPHALPSPEWSSSTGVEGSFASAEAGRFSAIEKVLDRGYRHRTNLPESLESYGLWNWPDPPAQWEAAAKFPCWDHTRTLSQHQEVWESWFLYLRSGTPYLANWARDNTRHFMDVGTINYDDSGHPLLGHLTGATYDGSGPTPWRSSETEKPGATDHSEVSAYYVNPNAYLASYLMAGDPIGRDLIDTWGEAVNRVAPSPDRSRNACVTLGELISYYEYSWDPQVLLHLHDLGDELLSRPWKESPFWKSYPVYHTQWVRRYWELTHDPRIQRQVLEYLKAGATDHCELQALAYEWTGDKSYLEPGLARLSSWWQRFYLNPADPLDGYGPLAYDPGDEGVAQEIPYFLQALLNAGLKLPTTNRGVDSRFHGTVRLKKDKPLPPTTWQGINRDTSETPFIGYLLPEATGNRNPVVNLELSVEEPAQLKKGSPCKVTYLRLEDAGGQVLLEQTLLPASMRPSVTVALDPRRNKPPYKLFINGPSPTLRWTGAANGLELGPTGSP